MQSAKRATGLLASACVQHFQKRLPEFLSQVMKCKSVRRFLPGGWTFPWPSAGSLNLLFFANSWRSLAGTLQELVDFHDIWNENLLHSFQFGPFGPLQPFLTRTPSVQLSCLGA